MNNKYTLTHHGILGQKLGKRNGPPYPLNNRDHSASEKKAQLRNDLKRSDYKGLTDAQKMLIKRGSIGVSTALASYGAYRLYKSGAVNTTDIDKFYKTGKMFVENALETRLFEEYSGSDKLTTDPKTGFNKITQDLSREETQKLINPNHYQDNCKDVSYAYCERIKNGLDVQAKGNSLKGNLRDYAEKYFEGDPDINVKTVTGDSTNIKSRLEKQILKNSSYGDVGIVGVTFDPKYVKSDDRNHPIGHAFNFENISGKIVFSDSQGDRRGNIIDPTKYFSVIDPRKEVEFLNVSRLTEKVEVMKDAIENRR